MTTLSTRQRGIIILSGLAAAGQLEPLNQAINEILDGDLAISEIKEIFVQLYVYAGFPRSLNALGTLMAVVEDRRKRGINDAPGPDCRPLPNGSSLALGTTNQTELVGAPVAGALFDFCPEIDYFLKVHLFGDIFARNILTWQERELATIAMLANIEGVAPQLQAHIGISLHNGLTVTMLKESVDVLACTCSAQVGDCMGQALAAVVSGN